MDKYTEYEELLDTCIQSRVKMEMQGVWDVKAVLLWREDICKHLRLIWSEIAERNGIKLVSKKCPFKGKCPGTCQVRCEEEEYLNSEIRKKRKNGENIELMEGVRKWLDSKEAEKAIMTEKYVPPKHPIKWYGKDTDRYISAGCGHFNFDLPSRDGKKKYEIPVFTGSSHKPEKTLYSEDDQKKLNNLTRDNCRILRKIRERVAEANGIPFKTEECTYKGPCKGTCRACEKEIEYLRMALEMKRKSGEEVLLEGIAADVVGEE